MWVLLVLLCVMKRSVCRFVKMCGCAQSVVRVVHGQPRAHSLADLQRLLLCDWIVKAEKPLHLFQEHFILVVLEIG